MEESHPLSERLLEAEGELCWLLPSLAIQDSHNAFCLYLARAIWQGRLGNVVLFTTEQRLEIISVQLLSCVWLFVTPWTVVWQASLPSPTPGACSNSCPSSWWCRPTISSNTLAIWCEELTHWKRPWCWERLNAGREGDDRGWDGWMASHLRLERDESNKSQHKTQDSKGCFRLNYIMP